MNMSATNTSAVNAKIDWQIARQQVSIAGVVSDSETGATIAGAKVEITPTTKGALTRRTLTRADGLFVFIDLPQGDYSIAASLPHAGTRYGVISSEVSVISGRVPPNSPSLNLTLRLPPTAVSGRIIGNQQEGVEFAKVQVHPSGETVFSDKKGNYVLTGLEAGSITIAVSAQGYQPKSEAASLTSGQKTIMSDIQLE